MQSQFRFHSDRPLERSLLRVAGLLRPKLAATDRSFRSRIARLNLSPRQKKALADLTTGAAARAVEKQVSPSEFFRRATAAGRMLALLNTRADEVVRALTEYEKAAAPVYRSLPPGEAHDAEAARNHLHYALIVVLNKSLASVQEAESAVLYRVLASEQNSGSADELLDTFLRSIAQHFSAKHGAVFVPEEDDCLRRAASLQGGTGFVFSPGRRALRQLSKVSSSRPAVAGDWRESVRSVWSVPVGSCVLQLGFDDERPLLPRESELLLVLTERCRLALMRLEREARMREISVRMLEVEELERRRISRELHDDSAQALAVIRLHLEMLEFSVPPEGTELRARLAEIRELTGRTIGSVRRLISDLSPAVLEQLGLAAAVRQLANRFRRDNAMRLRLHIGRLPRTHPRLEVVIYRVLQECFRNIATHSQAEHINVSLHSSDGVLRLTVEDDGIGFDVQEAMGRRNCFGLIGIRERVTLLGGTFCAESTTRGRNSGEHPSGTSVMVQLPLTGDHSG